MTKKMFSDPFKGEAFLLNSLHEEVKVGSRGSGQAKFELTICDGVADLSLNFKLGHPSDKHCDGPHVAPQPDHHDVLYADDKRQEPFRPVCAGKSKAQRERNHLRAAQHIAATAILATKAAGEAAATAVQSSLMSRAWRAAPAQIFSLLAQKIEKNLLKNANLGLFAQNLSYY